jgi:uncharacterized membrane protein YdbT with pleckstrin-like domain
MSNASATEPAPSSAEEVLFDGHPALVPTAGALALSVLTLGLWLVVLLARSRGSRYRITTERIVIEEGLFSQRLEQVPLYRVVDFVVQRSVGERMMGTGTLVLETLERTTKELTLTGLPVDVRALYERLRTAAEAQRKAHLVRVVERE